MGEDSGTRCSDRGLYINRSGGHLVETHYVVQVDCSDISERLRKCIVTSEDSSGGGRPGMLVRGVFEGGWCMLECSLLEGLDVDALVAITAWCCDGL